MEEIFNMSKLFDHATKVLEAYHIQLQPLCKETGIPPLALDILLFIANNPQNATANDICRVRGVKSGIVSVHIERLVKGGLLERRSVPSDRRKTELVDTEAAQPLIKKGRVIQKQFADRLICGISEEDMAAWKRIMDRVDGNIEAVRREKPNKEK